MANKLLFLGAGCVGLVSGLCLAEAGHNVVCVDAISKRVDPLNASRATGAGFLNHPSAGRQAC